MLILWINADSKFIVSTGELYGHFVIYLRYYQNMEVLNIHLGVNAPNVTRNSDLIMHMGSHNGDYPINIVNMKRFPSFLRKSDLIIHVRPHTRVKSYKYS